MKVVTKKQMADIESMAVEKLGISTLILMENAAIAVASHCMKLLEGIKHPKAFIVAGPGNNGGDGLAVARHLYMRGVDVGVTFIGDIEKASENTQFNLNIVDNMGIPVRFADEGGYNTITLAIRKSHVVIDAMLGFGINADMEGALAKMAEIINQHALKVVAIDVPSGICPDTGSVLGTAVKADITVTLGAAKSGLFLHPACEYAGKIVVENICLPPSIIDSVPVDRFILYDDEAAQILPKRPSRSNKSTFGRVLALCGCDEMPGAASLSVESAYRTGSGIINAGVTQRVAGVIQNTCREAVTTILPDTGGFLNKTSAENIMPELRRATVVIIGPGIGANEQTHDFVTHILKHATTPLIIDADALNVLSANIEALKTLSAPAVITPHPGEMSRLTGSSIEDILNDTIGCATSVASEYGLTVVLKDARTIVADPKGHVFINTSGTPAMAKGGSGDVLTGIIAGFISQGMETFHAACLACYVHGKAGEQAAEHLSIYSVNASDIIKSLPLTLNRLSNLINIEDE